MSLKKGDFVKILIQENSEFILSYGVVIDDEKTILMDDLTPFFLKEGDNGVEVIDKVKVDDAFLENLKNYKKLDKSDKAAQEIRRKFSELSKSI